MPDVKDLKKRVDYLENGLEAFKERFSEKKMVELLGKALQTEKRHELIRQLITICLIGFVSLILIGTFQLVLYFFFTEAV